MAKKRNLRDCLDELKGAGEISEEEWRAIRAAFDARVAQHRLQFGDDEAARIAAASIAADALHDAAETRRRRIGSSAPCRISAAAEQSCARARRLGREARLSRWE